MYSINKFEQRINTYMLRDRELEEYQRGQGESLTFPKTSGREFISGELLQ